MSQHGMVDLAQVPFKSLVGRRCKDDFSDGSLAAELPHGEPIVLASPMRRSTPSLPEVRDRVRVHVPRLGATAWVWQLTDSGAQMIRWSGTAGTVDLTHAGEAARVDVSPAALIGRKDNRDFSPDAFVCELPHGERVEREDRDRRVRVWVPRLDLCAWVWQRTTDGVSMIKWLGTPEHPEGEPDAIVRVIADGAPVVQQGVLKRMWHRPASLPRGELLFRCPSPAPPASRKPPAGICTVLVPATLERTQVKAADVAEVSTPFHLLVDQRERLVPEPLLRELAERLDDLSGGRGPKSDAAAHAFAREVTRRDEVWRDLVDPELCLCAPERSGDDSDADGEDPPGRSRAWQAAEADVDAGGAVRWASWVNHLDGVLHAGMLQALAKLLQLALPQLEAVTGHRLHARRLQVVVRAYEQELKGSEALPYRIAEWHTDGRPQEHVVGTAACYVEVEEGLSGGAVEFAGSGDLWLDDPEATHKVQPATGLVLAFNNAMLRHRVDLLRGRGRRRTVAFHLVSPEHRQLPAASTLPRQLRYQCFEETFHALLPMRLPIMASCLIARFASGGLTLAESTDARRQERRSRLAPRETERPRRRTTGTWLRTTGVFRIDDVHVFSSTGTSEGLDDSD